MLSSLHTQEGASVCVIVRECLASRVRMPKPLACMPHNCQQHAPMTTLAQTRTAISIVYAQREEHKDEPTRG